MTFNYVTVEASSEFFAPATRAFGDIAIIGRGGIGGRGSPPQPFSNPSDAVKAYPAGSTTLLEPAAAAASPPTISTPVSFPAGTVVVVDEGESAEVRTVVGAAGTEVAKGHEGEQPSSRPADEAGEGYAGDADRSARIGQTAAEPSAYTLTLDSALTKSHDAGAKVAPEGPSDLAAAISVAFRQTPPPTRIWGIEVAPGSTGWDDALTATKDLAVQLVVLANTPLNANNSTLVGKLASHVTTVSNTGGDGKERIGVAMLDPTLPAKKQAEFNTGAVKVERMVLVAHKARRDDVAAATAGVIAGQEPHVSMLLKPIAIDMTDLFTVEDIDDFVAASVNWVTSPVLIPGGSLYLGEGLTASAGNKKGYIDIVRTLDDVSFRVKAGLIEAVGNLRIDRPGLRTLVTLVQTVLSPLVTRGVLEDYAIHIPLLVLLEKEPGVLTATERDLISKGRSARIIGMDVSVVYAGVVHQLHVKLAFKG
ncbi:hypothetical protein [Streptomyces sp. CB03911]|uniref:hypothetical protein n=1 Tax=Streptomycetaceae TaxID=2062 RepID=UPI00095B29E8|nr:hypothetical protein [Streptomyces sp. CB03911]OKI13280.1 hypothetical protein A6A07_15355 [Streptomyces sp. CB03911]